MIINQWSQVALKLTFDRIEADCAPCKVGSDPLTGTVIEVRNAVAQATYISSIFLRNYLYQIEERPIKYKYDHCSVCSEFTNKRTNNTLG